MSQAGRDVCHSHNLGREGDEEHIEMGCGVDKHRGVLLLHRADQAWLMRAFAFDTEVRPLKMKPEKTLYAIPCGGFAGFERSRRRGRPVGDQRGQQGGGSKLRMGAADRADRLHARRIVEKDAAAAIHLQIDETGRQDAAIEVDHPAVAECGGGGDTLYDAVLEEQRLG
jgi:hypothetical protein